MNNANEKGYRDIQPDEPYQLGDQYYTNGEWWTVGKEIDADIIGKTPKQTGSICYTPRRKLE